MNQATTTDYDIIIVGGGLAGVTLAHALDNQGLRIALIESAEFRQQAQPNYDDRAIALSYGTRRVFEGLGLWQLLSKLVTPIHKIHVSDRGHFGVTRINCREEGVEALGYVITARDLGKVLVEAVTPSTGIDIISPATVSGITIPSGHATLDINFADGKSKTLSTQLVVAADGGQSSMRSLLSVEAKHYDYRQTAIIANISCQRFHDYIAYERFTDQGPIALLPMSDLPMSDPVNQKPSDNGHRCALVWTQPSEQAEHIMALDDTQFLTRLQERFGQRLGRFIKVGTRNAHPLHLIRSSQQVRERLAIIGNAAHTLHPIAGQGFNLGVRDVAALAQVLVDAARRQQDPGSLEVLQEYARWRERDQQTMTGFTDNLVRVFSNRFAPLALARNAGLIATDLIGPVKHTLARHTMGIAGKLPRLARGLQL
jgi:2-octaprenyl-6-methoxyphenol hydroxylase